MASELEMRQGNTNRASWPSLRPDSTNAFYSEGISTALQPSSPLSITTVLSQLGMTVETSVDRLIMKAQSPVFWCPLSSLYFPGLQPTSAVSLVTNFCSWYLTAVTDVPVALATAPSVWMLAVSYICWMSSPWLLFKLSKPSDHSYLWDFITQIQFFSPVTYTLILLSCIDYDLKVKWLSVIHNLKVFQLVFRNKRMFPIGLQV